MTTAPYPLNRALREGFRLAAPLLAALVLALYAFSLLADFEERQPIRLLAFLPVALAAYRRRGLLTGLVYATAFGVLYIWEAAWALAPRGVTELQPEAITATLFLFAAALVFASVAEGRRSREVLADRAEDRRQLLERTLSQDQVAAFVRQEAQRDAYAHEAALLLRTDAGEGWRLLAADQALAVPPVEAGTEPALAAWLVEQARQVVIDDLDADPRFAGRSDMRSLVSLPMWGIDGTLQGLLVLLDRRPARFSTFDLAPLYALAEAAGAALTQAGAFALTERALHRLAARLTTIERAARDLNSTLDRDAVAEKGLAYARAVTGAAAGAILATSGPEPPAVRAIGSTLTAELRGLLTRGAGLPAAVQEPVLAAAGGLTAETGSRLVVPVRRGEHSLGALVVAGSKGAFEPYDLQVLATLAEHIAVALENAALLSAVRYERERAEQVIENTADGLVILDAAGRVTRMNRAAVQLTGWTPAEASGRPAAELLGAEQPEAQAALPFTNGERRRIRTRTGTRRVLALSATALPAPEQGTVLLLHDATAEEEMARFQRELIATFSHELRAPLTNMAAVTELLLAAEGSQLEGRPRGLVQILRGQTLRLAALAERTLDVARLEAGQRHLEPRPVPAARAAEEALDRWRATAGDGRLCLEPPPANLWAWADEEAVASVLDTLLDNALKYAGAGTAVTLGVCREDGAAVAFTVADNGPGVPPETQARLFQRFSRGDASDSQRVYGYGLGLYAARLLVEAMGGTIRLESQPGAGSRFTFTVPRMAEDRATDGAP